MNNISQETLNTLIQMQIIDDEITDLNRRMEKLPKKLEELKQKFKDSEIDLSEKRLLFEENLKKQKTLEMDMLENSNQIKKYETQLMAIKTNREYKALNSEIALLGKKNNKLEEDEIVLMEAESEIKGEVSNAESRLKTAQNDLEVREKEIKQELRTIEKGVENLRQNRNTLAKQLPIDIVKKYVLLLKFKNRKAVVFNNKNACSSCGFTVRAQIQVELLDATEIIYCDNCGRILVNSFKIS